MISADLIGLPRYAVFVEDNEMANVSTVGNAKSAPMTGEQKKVIFASSLGTVFEWYDFYLYGSLAIYIGATFFSQYPETTRNIFALLAFAAGPSVCLIGDGGLQFSVQELASAVEAGIATAVVIWNNTSYGEIKAFMAERDIPQIGVDIFTPDFVGLARALGCEASRPDVSNSACRPSILALIEVQVLPERQKTADFGRAVPPLR